MYKKKNNNLNKHLISYPFPFSNRNNFLGKYINQLHTYIKIQYSQSYIHTLSFFILHASSCLLLTWMGTGLHCRDRHLTPLVSHAQVRIGCDSRWVLGGRGGRGGGGGRGGCLAILLIRLLWGRPPVFQAAKNTLEW